MFGVEMPTKFAARLLIYSFVYTVCTYPATNDISYCKSLMMSNETW